MIDAVVHPRYGDYVVVNSRTGCLYDGNGRVLELQRRAERRTGPITKELMVPVEFYEPDYSMFPDLPE